MEQLRICGYARISVDLNEEWDENTSIETQKNRIKAYIQREFPEARFDPLRDMYIDRDKSGYTFEQRTGYQKMKAAILRGEYDILVVKDITRFCRRVSLGAMELECILSKGVTIIGCDDGTNMKKNIGLNAFFHLFLAEDTVTSTSNKVSKAIETRQEKGTWICNAPYGYYIRPDKKGQIFVDEEGKAAVQKIFELYNQGHGYKSISHYMTEHGYPTGRALMVKQMKDRGADTSKMLRHAPINPVWSAVSISKIVTNDYYIGTLRTGVWERSGINKADKRTDKSTHHVFPNHHEPMIDMETWEKAQRMYRKSTRNNYSGTSLYKNPYTGIVKCADCGSPMFAVGGKKYRRGYNCGNYLKNGIKGQNENRKRKRKSEYTDLGCTASHFIAEETLDQYVKTFIARVKEKLSEALAGLDVEKSIESANADRMTIRDLEKEKEGIEAQLDILAEQRIEQIAKKPNRKEQIARRYDELEEKLEAQIENIDLRITYLSDQSAKKKELKQSYEEVIKRFDELLQKPSFLKTDLNTIIREITVDDDKVVTIQLYSDITELFALAE